MIKKLFAMLFALSMALCLSGCEKSAKSESDLLYVKGKGTLVVGITEFKPMDYQDANGNWVGFDADMAVKFAESLGVKAEFKVIDWNKKVSELTSKSIDAVWNGMTLSDEVITDMECSKPYCNNAQTVIVPADKAADYQSVNSVKGLSFAVEAGSAGKQQVEALGAEFTEVKDQTAALEKVASGGADAAVIDLLMASAAVGEGADYAGLTNTVNLSSEEYGVGFRKGSDLASSLNAFLKSSYSDGSMIKIAERYGVQSSILPQ